LSRKDQKARTRSTILQAARDLFAARGYEAATMRELATRAGVAVGTINLHFADKTSLLAAALDEDIEAALAGAEVPADAPLERRLEALIRPLYAYYAERPELSRVLVKESLLLAGEWGRHFTEQLARFRGSIHREVERGIARSELAAGADAQAISEALMAYYFFLLMDGLRSEGFDTEGQLARFRGLVRLHTQPGESP